MGKGDISDLTTKFCVGSTAAANKTYREVDYKELRAKLQEEKLKVHLDRQHLKKFQTVKETYSNTSAQNQHKEVWLKEDIAIKSQIKTTVSNNDPSDLSKYSEITEYHIAVNQDHDEFEQNTVAPIWDFIEDVKNWKSDQSNSEDIKEVFTAMFAQQGNILTMLAMEGNSLESELHLFNKEIKSWKSETQKESLTESLLVLKFPNDEVLCEYLEEYLSIDHQYSEAFTNLKDYYSVVLDKGKLGGWTEADHYTFIHITQQYPVDKFQRSALCLEMLKMVMPQFLEQEVKEHSEWVQLNALYTEHRKSLENMHETTLKKLIERAKRDSKQQWELYNQTMKKADEQLAQKEKTVKIYEELIRCRKQKAAQIKQEQKLIEDYSSKMMKQRQAIQRRKEKEKSITDKKLYEFQSLKRQKEAEYEAKMRSMIEKQDNLKKKQLQKGKQRVDYRDAQQQEKEAEKQARKEEVERLEREKQERLDKLAATVAIEAEVNPLRVLKDTESTTSRLKETEYYGKTHLFKIIGYDSETIRDDMRFKVEAALRNAGLINTDYGRHVMKGIKPPTEPRRDQVSTVFKKEENS